MNRQAASRRAGLRGLAACLLVAVLAAPGAQGQGVAVEGSDTARIRPPAVDPFPPYANAGYRLTHGEGGEVVVEVSLEPLASAAPFPPAAAGTGEAGKAPTPRETGTGGSTPPAAKSGEKAAKPAEGTSAGESEVARLARRLTAEARTQHAAVSAVLGWMARNVADSTAIGGNALIEPGAAAAAPADPQAPEAVLARRSGEPVGVARLAVALLTAAGLEARVVRGVVAGLPEPGGAFGRHAWIEVRYPDRGWVFSDPLRHHHFVPATYLRAAPTAAAAPPEPKGEAKAAGRKARTETAGGEAPAGQEQARVLERRDLRKTVDLYPPGAPGVTARRNRPEQVAAALRVVVAGGGRALAVLEGPDGRVSKVLPGGEGVFVGLAGGRYRLEVFPDGGPPVVRQVDVQARERGAVFIRQDSAARPAAPRSGDRHRGGRRTSHAP